MEEEKLIKYEAKRKKEKTKKWGAKISAPTLKTQPKAKSTQSNWVDSFNQKKKSFSKFWSIFQTPNFQFKIFIPKFSIPQILWRKVCKWLEVCNYWLVISLLDIWLIRRAGYAMMLSKWLLIGFFLINNTWFCWLFRWVEWKWLILPEELWKIGSETLNLRTISMILDSMKVKKEILKAAPLEAD